LETGREKALLQKSMKISYGRIVTIGAIKFYLGTVKNTEYQFVALTIQIFCHIRSNIQANIMPQKSNFPFQQTSQMTPVKPLGVSMMFKYLSSNNVVRRFFLLSLSLSLLLKFSCLSYVFLFDFEKFLRKNKNALIVKKKIYIFCGGKRNPFDIKF